jgi:transcription elongation factor Elf1
VSKRGLTKHLKTKHGEETLELVVGSKVCALCNIFCKRNEIGEHMKKAHPESKIEFECDFCHARFSSKSKMERHRNIHKPKEEKFTCNLCGFETWSQDSLNRHMYRHYASFNCSLCDYNTTNKATLARHNEKMHGTMNQTAFPCDKCNKFLPTKGALKKHCQRHH